MLTVQQAESIILDSVNPLQEAETIDLESSLGRILAKSVISQLHFPHWDNSAMDGYAVQGADVGNCDEQNPVVLTIVEEIAAGVQPQRKIKSGEAARIFTGAMLPEGADTVVMQEHTQREGDRVKVFQAQNTGQFVRRKGEFYRAGNPLLPSGIILSEADLAVLAAAQCTQLEVYHRPKVAIFSTGNELVTPEQPLQLGKIVDSNQYALAAFIARNGGLPIKLGIIRDRRDELRAAIAKAVQVADVVLSTGGVSVGEYDYVEEILAELGGEIVIRSVAIKPGKPLTVARFPNCLYFGLPGNPVSALVSCWRFVQPALKKLSGLVYDWQPAFVQARSRQDLSAGGKRETYLWGRLHLVNGLYEFELAGGGHSSGNLINLAQTNGLGVIPMGQNSIAAGDAIQVMQLT